MASSRRTCTLHVSSRRKFYCEDETDSEADDSDDAGRVIAVPDWPTTNKRTFGTPSDSKQPIKQRKQSNEVAGPSSRKSTPYSMDINRNCGVPVPGTCSAAKTKAMLNELVLEKVAKRLLATELIKLRQTCTSWNQCFVPELQKTYNRPISLHNVPDLHEGKLTMKSYTNLLQSSAGIPFTQYKLYDSTQAPLQDFKDFFSVCGGHIRDLSLDSQSKHKGVNSANMDKIRQIIFQLAPELSSLTIKPDADEEVPTWKKRQKSRLNKLPNLRRLNLAVVGPLPLSYHDLLISIIQSSESLKSLSLEGRSNECNWKMVSYVQDHMPCLEKLKSLHMHGLRAPELEVLLELARRKDRPLRLQNFCTSLLYRREQHREMEELFYSFLVTQAATLQNFDIDFDGNAIYPVPLPLSGRTISLPPMKSLQTFKLRWHARNEAFVLYEKNTLENNFPQLKQFTYSLFNPYPWRVPLKKEILDDIRMQSVHTHLTDLALNVDFLKVITLKRFAPVLPSVTRLQLELTQYTVNLIEAVWTMWPALTSLEIKITSPYSSTKPIRNLDEVLTGILVSKYATLKKQLDSEPGTLTHARARALLSKHKTKPGVSDLTLLQRFSLKLENQAFEITDISGSFGFAMANPALQYMMVVEGPRVAEQGKNPINRISAECRQFIKSAFHPFAVIEV